MDRIRSAIVLTAAGIAALPVLAISTVSASATEWCGATDRNATAIECGYTSAADCESATGKGGICFVDPDIVLNATTASHGRPSLSTKGPRQS